VAGLKSGRFQSIRQGILVPDWLVFLSISFIAAARIYELTSNLK